MKWSRFVLLLVAVTLPGMARGDALEEAKRVAKQAGIHYQLGRFQQAADTYARSYELVPTPGLLFNLGQCQMMLKDWDKAIFFFEGYLRDKADAPNGALARDLIAEARRDIAAQKAHEVEVAAARNAQVAQPAPRVEPQIVVAPPPARDARRAPAVALGATSIALVAAGGYLGERADSANALGKLAAAGSSTKSGFAADHRHFVLAAAVTGGVGAACAVAGGVLGYLGWRQPKTRVGVAPRAGGAAAMISAEF